MKLTCPSCGANLRVNPNLLGATVTCPSCGTSIESPKSGAQRKASAPAPRPSPPPPSHPVTLWLILAQGLLFLLASSCIAGALFRDRWKPPLWSYLQEERLWLVVAGVAIGLFSMLTRRLPVVMTLGASLVVMWGCAFHFRAAREVDASRTLALSVAMLAVWSGLQHRRTIR